MAVPQRREALTKAADAQRHPAAPAPAPEGPPPAPPPVARPEVGEPPRPATTMFSVRVPVELRTKVKLAAIRSGLTVEQWTTIALTRATEADD